MTCVLQTISCLACRVLDHDLDDAHIRVSCTGSSKVAIVDDAEAGIALSAEKNQVEDAKGAKKIPPRTIIERSHARLTRAKTKTCPAVDLVVTSFCFQPSFAPRAANMLAKKKVS